jgi:hypothetical protein
MDFKYVLKMVVADDYIPKYQATEQSCYNPV